MSPLILFAIVAIAVVLGVLVVDTVRAARQMGGLPPFTPTHRAYGA